MCFSLSLSLSLSVDPKAGGYISEDLVPGIVARISESEELHAYVVQKLYLALNDNIAQVCSTVSTCRTIIYSN